jgi:hypothetical protein
VTQRFSFGQLKIYFTSFTYFHHTNKNNAFQIANNSFAMQELMMPFALAGIRTHDLLFQLQRRWTQHRVRHIANILAKRRLWQGCQMVCFQTKNPKFGLIFEGLWMVNVGIFYDHLEYFMAIWNNLWPFGIVCGHLLYFSRSGMFGPRKIWQPWSV